MAYNVLCISRWVSIAVASFLLGQLASTASAYEAHRLAYEAVSPITSDTTTD